ncbi:hypothetical protein BDW60DRAFT_212091 [Aspergillus nidulans var. acristatus]
MSDAQDARNPYDITFGIVDIGPATSMIEVTFQESLYDLPACHAILDTYMRLLETFTLDSISLVKECEVNNPEDVSKALELGRDTRREARYQGKTEHDLVFETESSHQFNGRRTT